MSSEMEGKARELADIILNSEEYQNYIRSREALKGDWELYQRVSDFRRQNFAMQLLGDSGRIYEDMDRLEQEFAPSRRDSRVSEFLQNELSLCKMMQNINEIIIKDLDFEVDFLE